MSEAARRWISPEAYLELENLAETKSEYFNGQVFAMSGGTSAHSLISVNISGELRQLLKSRPCQVHSSDMKVKCQATGLYTYADVTVVCGNPLFEDEPQRTLLNPILIVEVLSETTEEYDRTDKFEHYKRIESIQDYLLVSSDRKQLELYSRPSGVVISQKSEWAYVSLTDPEGFLDLPSVGCALSVAEVYSKVELAPPTRKRRPLLR